MLFYAVQRVPCYNNMGCCESLRDHLCDCLCDCWDHLDDGLDDCLDDCSNNRLRVKLCCVLLVVGLAIGILLLLIGFTVFFATYSPPLESTQAEVGGNVPVLLNLAGFDPFWYDQVEITNITTTSNITLFRGLCDDLTTAHKSLPPKKVSFGKANMKSRFSFNYYGGDIPVYIAPDVNGSFISFNVSAEATAGSHNEFLSCGVQLFNFVNFTSYIDFLNKEFTDHLTKQDTQCIPVGPPGSPLTSSVTFYLNEPGFYWQAMIVNTSVLMNTTVSGIVSFYNTSSLGSVLCNFTHAMNCSVRISMLPSTPNRHVCVLALSDTLGTVKVKAVRSIWNIGTVITASAVLMLSILLCCCCCCCCCCYYYYYYYYCCCCWRWWCRRRYLDGNKVVFACHNNGIDVHARLLMKHWNYRNSHCRVHGITNSQSHYGISTCINIKNGQSS